MNTVFSLVRVALTLCIGASVISCAAPDRYRYCNTPWIRWYYGISSLGTSEIIYRCISPETTRRAMEGNADDMYYLAHNLTAGYVNQRWLCRAAHAGHVDAQFEMALDHEKSEDDAQGNKVRAFIWYSLAVQGGHVEAVVYRNDLESRMTSDELSKANLLVTNWKPGPQECD